MKKNSLILRDIKRIIKKSFKRIILVSIFISFLFYLFNIFAWLSIKINDISNIITNKVGIYFYIQDNNKTTDEIFKRVIQIKDNLADKWIKSEFSSKDDAFSYLDEKVPEITKNFDKFGIENPLPSTLYVMFHDQKEYNIMKDIIIENKDIILNIKDVDKWATLVQQENRSLRIINIINTIKSSLYFIVIMLTLIIVFFTQHLLRHFFHNFYKEIEVKKLLWAKNREINLWFLIILWFTITLWFIIWYIITCITFSILNHNLILINVDISLCDLLPKLLLSYIFFIIIWLWLWYKRLKEMERKF
jgi:cell division protein FtsX